MGRGFWVFLRKCSLGGVVAVLGALVPADSAHAQAPTAQVVQIEVAFDYAMVALQQNRPDVAIPIFQAILAENPKLTRVRLELARAYFMAEKWALSRQEFFRALSGDLPEPVRQNVLGFIRQIDARRGFDWDLSIGLTTAGNSNSYDSQNIQVNPAYAFGATSLTYERPRERVPAARIRGAMTLRKPFEGLSSAERGVLGFASLGLDALEAEGRDYDDYELRLRLGLRLLSPQTTISFGPVLSKQWYQGDHYEDRHGIEAAFERRSETGVSVYGAASLLSVDNAFNDNYDGASYSASLGVRRSVGGRAVIGTQLDYERRDSDGAMVQFDGYHAYTLSLYSTVDVSNGWTLRPRVFLRHRTAQERNPLFVDNPDETLFGASLRVERSDIFLPGGYTPYAQIDYEQNRSGIDAFSYDSVGFQIGVERRF